MLLAFLLATNNAAANPYLLNHSFGISPDIGRAYDVALVADPIPGDIGFADEHGVFVTDSDFDEVHYFKAGGNAAVYHSTFPYAFAGKVRGIAARTLRYDIEGIALKDPYAHFEFPMPGNPGYERGHVYVLETAIAPPRRGVLKVFNFSGMLLMSIKLPNNALQQSYNNFGGGVDVDRQGNVYVATGGVVTMWSAGYFTPDNYGGAYVVPASRTYSDVIDIGQTFRIPLDVSVDNRGGVHVIYDLQSYFVFDQATAEIRLQTEQLGSSWTEPRGIDARTDGVWITFGNEYHSHAAEKFIWSASGTITSIAMTPEDVASQNRMGCETLLLGAGGVSNAPQSFPLYIAARGETPGGSQLPERLWVFGP